jgi:DnaJ-class molecular chaperone
MYYEILELETKASDGEIKKRCREPQLVCVREVNW